MTVSSSTSFYANNGPTPADAVELESAVKAFETTVTSVNNAALAAYNSASDAQAAAQAATAAGAQAVTDVSGAAAAAVSTVTQASATAVANLNAALPAITAAAVDAAEAAAGVFTQTGDGAVSRRVVDKLKDYWVSAEDFGAAGDGVTNDRGAIQAAINAVAARGGGNVVLTKRYLVSGADLRVRDGVTLVGSLLFAGGQMPGADYSTLAPAIVLSPANPIRLGRHSGLLGLPILRTGLTVPTTARDGYTIPAAMTGTAIVLGDATNYGSNAFGGSFLTGANANIAADAVVQNCMVLGFDLAIYSDFNSRVLVKNLLMDCRNGVIIRRGYDSCRVENLRSWPFLTGNTVAAKTDYTLTAVAQGTNASRTRLTTSGSTVFQAGDVVHVWGVTNFPTLLGRQTVLSVASGYIEVDCAYAPTGTPALATSRGVTIWGNRRTGTMLMAERTDGLSVMGGYAYGMQRGFLFGDEMNWAEIHSCAVDDWITLLDQTTVGYEFQGSVNACSIFGFSASSMARPLIYNSTMGAHLPIYGGLLGATPQNTASGTVKGVTVGGGSVGLYGVNGGDITAYIASGSGGIIQLGGSLGLVTAADGIGAGRYVKLAAPGEPGIKDYTSKEHLFGTSQMDGSVFPKMRLRETGEVFLGPRTSGNGSQLQLSRGTDRAVAAVISLAGGANPVLTIAGEGTNNPNTPIQFGGVGASANPQVIYTARYDTTIAAGSQVGTWAANGSNAGAAATVQYGRLTFVAEATTAGSEKGRLDFVVKNGGSEFLALRASNSRVQAGSPLQLPSYAVAALPPATDYTSAALVHCTNGDAGNPCLAVAVGGVWRKVLWGAQVAAA